MKATKDLQGEGAEDIKCFFYRNLKPKRFIWNELLKDNAAGDHSHKFQFGSIGMSIQHRKKFQVYYNRSEILQ